MSEIERLREALLPCPFCGAKADFERLGTARQCCIIVCEECTCRLETGETWDCGAAWNRRAALAATPTAERGEWKPISDRREQGE